MFALGDRVTTVRTVGTGPNAYDVVYHGTVTNVSSAPVEYEVAFAELPELVVILGSRLKEDSNA